MSVDELSMVDWPPCKDNNRDGKSSGEEEEKAGSCSLSSSSGKARVRSRRCEANLLAYALFVIPQYVSGPDLLCVVVDTYSVLCL